MINEVTIKNFKSVQNTSLKLGRFNVMIGSNGSGKSNILEAIAFGAAASADKLDNEFLPSRGVRPASSKLMKSVFYKHTEALPICLEFRIDGKEILFNIDEIEKPILKWAINERIELEEKLADAYYWMYNKRIEDSPDYKVLSEKEKENIKEISNKIKEKPKSNDPFQNVNYIKSIVGNRVFNQVFTDYFFNQDLAKFIIYAPENNTLRLFETESQIKPLGIKGEGLFDVLQIFNESYGKETIEEIKNYLHLIEWFDDFEAVSDQVTGRKSLVVKDRYLPDARLNQTNVNEGFLYLLFYISLFVSKETPTFFAIDNIEASFHPTLVEELIRNLIQLSKKHNKQIIITTHNPFVLDGLNLNDEEQKLFVIRRNADGETIADPITNTSKRIKLSEAWIRGQFGGQPKNIR